MPKTLFLRLVGSLGLLALLGWQRLAAQAQDFAFVVNSLSDDVTVVDLSTNAVVTTIPVGSVPVDVAASPDSLQLAVVDAASASVSFISATQQALLGTFPIAAANGTINDAVYSRTGDSLYVSDLSGGRVFIMAAPGGAILDTITISGGGPTAMELRPGTSELYVVLSSRGELLVLDMNTNQPIDTILLEGATTGGSTNPFSIAITPDGSTAIVGNSSSNFSNIIDLTTKTVFRVQEEAFGVTSDALLNNSIEVAVSPDNVLGFLIEQGANELNIIDLATRTYVNDQFGNPATDDVIAFGAGTVPQGVVVTPDGATAVVTLTDTDEIALVDVASRTETARISVGTTPRDVVVVKVQPCPATPVMTQISDTVCEDALPFVFGGQSLTVSGTYTDTLLTSGGCDSILTLTLTVGDTAVVAVADTICASALPFAFGSQSITSAGVFTETFQTALGCDSVVTLDLTVNPTFADTLVDAVCDNELPYLFGGQSLTASGFYADSLLSAAGCDSIIVLDLTVNPTFDVTDSVFICDGQSIVFGGQTLDSTGVYVDTFQTVGGCDSAVTLVLTVGNLTIVNFAQTICDTDSFLFAGQQLTMAGVYTDTLVSSTGCDSVNRLTLSVNPTFDLSVADTVCDSELPYVFGSQSLMMAGTFTELFQTAAGCDSLVTLALTVTPTFSETLADTICDSELPYVFGSQSLMMGGTFTEVFAAASGCDSTVTLDLTVNPTFDEQVTDSVCETELPYAFGSQSLMMGGTFTEAFATESGCDSSVTLTLTVLDTAVVSAVDSIEAGQSIQFGSQTITMPGDYTETFVGANGCDSTVNLTVTQATNLAQIREALALRVYPNPATAELKVQYRATSTGEAQLTVYNQLGQKIWRTKQSVVAGKEQVHHLDLMTWPEGLYYLVIQVGTQQVEYAFRKQAR